MPDRPALAKSAPQRALDKLGLRRPIDLALHLPMRYEDETTLLPIAALRHGSVAQVEGVVRDSEVQIRGRRQLVVRLSDGSDDLVLRFLHFYPSHQKAFAAGRRLRVRGEARGGFLGLEMVHPTFKAVEGDTPLPSALTPVYPTTAQLPQAYLRKAVAAGLARADLSELLPPHLVPPHSMSLRDALTYLHHPPAGAGLAAVEDHSHPAWQRLKFEELLAQQLSQLQAKRERELQRAPRFAVARGGLQERLLAALPFRLTRAQRRVVEEIARDLQREVPMHRLLQGDVGSGKTVVAALAALAAVEAKAQVALVAPTELLAEQHWNSFRSWLQPLGIEPVWLAGKVLGKARSAALAAVADGAPIVIGTHALMQEGVAFRRLGLAIIDEQHRFGVHQRLALRDKGRSGDVVPHQLVLTATPIPRTLAMTAYADLDVSVIDELPPGRAPVQTVAISSARRAEVIERIRAACAEGRQAYWVCTLIEESDQLEAQAAEVAHAELTAALPGVAIGLVHGRLRPKEKQAAMDAFKTGALRVLVATTVIEVGVDVPNASLMVIENAERLGLAQLHQLRGRVGRGSAASSCVLLYQGPLSQMARARLEAMRETSDGFRIAEKDLELRGPGELLGTRQTGQLEFRVADLARDAHLLPSVQRVGEAMMRDHAPLAERLIARWIGGAARYAGA